MNIKRYVSVRTMKVIIYSFSFLFLFSNYLTAEYSKSLNVKREVKYLHTEFNNHSISISSVDKKIYNDYFDLVALTLGESISSIGNSFNMNDVSLDVKCDIKNNTIIINTSSFHKSTVITLKTLQNHFEVLNGFDLPGKYKVKREGDSLVLGLP